MFFSACGERNSGLVPDAGLTYDQVITIPDARSSTLLPRIQRLINQRIANQSVRSTTYFFADDGSDSGLGTEVSPWQSIARVNSLVQPMTGNRVAAVRHTVSSNANFRIAGQSWWMGGWIKTNDTYYGPLFEIEGSYGFFTGTSGGNVKPGFFYWIGGSRNDIDSNISAPATDWTYLESWFDHTTRTLSICVNNGAVYSTVMASQMDDVNAPFWMGNGFAGTAFSGDMARLFFVADVVPSNANRTAMYNGGKGCRSYMLPQSLKTIFTTNSGSYWDLSGVDGTTTYADFFSGQTFTRGTAQSPVVINGPDHDAAIAIVGGDITGGMDFAVAFKRGDRFVFPLGGAINCTRENPYFTSWGSGALPIIDACSVTVPTTWTATSSHYKCTCDPVGWLYRATEDSPTDVPLFKAEDATECNATNNSFFYDTVGGELHLNIGSSPDGIAFLASPRITDANNDGTSNVIGPACKFGVIENIFFRGSGVTEPGNDSGYGLQLNTGDLGAYQPEVIVRNCDFTGGYHALGIFGVGGASVTQNCRMWNIVGRNQSGTLGDVSGTHFVAFGADQEVILDGNSFGGYLPSWDCDGIDFPSGTIVHGATAEDHPALHVDLNSVYLPTTYPCSSATSVSGPDPAGDWTALRTFVINTTYDAASYKGAFGSIFGPGVCGINITANQLLYADSSGYVLGSPRSYLINYTQQVNCQNNAGTMFLCGNVAAGSAVYLFGSRFDFINTNGNIQMAAAPGFTIEAKNTLITGTGSGVVSLGPDASAGSFTNCAWLDAASAIGSGGVLLTGAAPSLTVAPLTSSPLHNAGATVSGVTPYDKNNTTRASTPTIGPIEAA